MEQKRVSYRVAKALKEAGYPQGNTQGQYAKMSYYDNELEHKIEEGTYTENFIIHGIDAPTYIDVWLWLWRGKDIQIHIKKWPQPSCVGSIIKGYNGLYYEIYRLDINDPEEAIIAAIEYIVDNDLIK